MTIVDAGDSAGATKGATAAGALLPRTTDGCIASLEATPREGGRSGGGCVVAAGDCDAAEAGCAAAERVAVAGGGGGDSTKPHETEH